VWSHLFDERVALDTIKFREHFLCTKFVSNHRPSQKPSRAEMTYE
jgi:hypothetical protein